MAAAPSKGSHVEVYWPGDAAWFAATVYSTRRCDGATHLRNDRYGDFTSVAARTAFHVLSEEKWRFIS